MEETRFEEMENMNEAYDVVEVTETCNQTCESEKKGGGILGTAIGVAVGAAVIGVVDNFTGWFGVTKKGKAKKTERAIKKLEKDGYRVTRLPEPIEAQVKFEEPVNEVEETEE